MGKSNSVNHYFIRIQAACARFLSLARPPRLHIDWQTCSPRCCWWPSSGWRPGSRRRRPRSPSQSLETRPGVEWETTEINSIVSRGPDKGDTMSDEWPMSYWEVREDVGLSPSKVLSLSKKRPLECYFHTRIIDWEAFNYSTITKKKRSSQWI